MRRDPYVPVLLAVCVAVGLAVRGAAAPRPADDVPVQRGAAYSAPVVPRVLDVDLRELPRVAPWKPGDPVRSVPRRHKNRPAPVPAPEPRLDPLLARARQMAVAGAAQRALSGPDLNIAGQGFSGVNPPDTVGDVGRNYYIQAINNGAGSTFTVYDKATGALVAGPTLMSSLGGTGGCANGRGDPIVLYDAAADRWLMIEFGPTSSSVLCLYISSTPGDPITGGWFHYAFNTPGFPDYPKVGVWRDAYYVTSNESSPAVYAVDRAAMLVGSGVTFQRVTAPILAGFGFQALTPADVDGPEPPPGTPGILMRHRDDEAHNSGANDPGEDYLELFTFDVDFNNAGNSAFTGPISIPVAEFDSDLNGLTSFAAIPQPGSTTELDPLREVIMHRLQYRNFVTHETLVGSFVTDVTGTDHAGVRWFELRRTGGGSWTLHQEGTVAPDSDHRWMSSIAMDASGNIALGYNVAGSGTFPSLRYTGRLASDPLGTMPQGESNVVAGTAANGSNRYGDYAALAVDPFDGCTFWFTGEYNPASTWATRIATFSFDACGCVPPPVPSNVIATATATNTVELTWPAVPGAAAYNVYGAVGTCPAGSLPLLAAAVTGTAYTAQTPRAGDSYVFEVRSTDGSICQSDPSPCVSAVAEGLCLEPPLFAGATGVERLAGGICGLRVSWAPASLPCGTALGYNVYRGTDAGFTPGPSNLVAGCLGGTSYDDRAVVSGTIYHYVVRAEADVPGAGPCLGGLEDGNTTRVSALARGADVALLEDDMESGTSGWITAALAGDTSTSAWARVTTDSASPTHAWFCLDEEVVKDRVLQTASPIALPSGEAVELSFQHRFDLETSFDGGVLEFSIDGGSSWFDINAGVPAVFPARDRFLAGGYNSTISTDYSSPISGREAWSGALGGFTEVRVDLADMAGQNLLLRWRLACDVSVDDVGWWVDDVLLAYPGTCEPGGYAYWQDLHTWSKSSGQRSEDETQAGLGNFTAYFFGFNATNRPGTNALLRLPRIEAGAGGLTYTFTHATNDWMAGWFTVRHSTNATDWLPLLPQPTPDTNGTVRVVVPELTPRRIYRLDITE